MAQDPSTEIISMIKWIQFGRLSINESLSRAGHTRVDRADDEIPSGVGEDIPKRCGFDRAPGREHLDLVPHLSRACVHYKTAAL